MILIPSTMLLKQIIIAVLAGLLAHNAIFIRGEWHLRIPQIAVTHAFLWFCASVLVYSSDGDDVSLGLAVSKASFLSTLYLAGLFGSMIVYRLFFHRLAGFKGPRLAAVSKFWHVYKVRSSTNHVLMTRLYKKYGSIIRTGRLSAVIVRTPSAGAKMASLYLYPYSSNHIVSKVRTKLLSFSRTRSSYWTVGIIPL